MNQDGPLVSVLMTSYNREKYITEAVESVLASSYKNFELIIVDDRSIDKTVSIAVMYGQKDSRVKVFVNEKNVGDYNNRNKAASLAKGKYIKYLDSDDTIYPWGLEAMIYCMEKFPEAGFGLMSYGLPVQNTYPILVQPQDAYRAFFFKNSLIAMGPTGTIIRKNVFDELGGFSGENYVGDTEFWLRASATKPLIRMPLDLVWWREHDGQQMREEVKNKDTAVRRYHIYKDAILHPNCPLSEVERIAVLKNLENLRLRDILTRYFFRLKISQGFSLLKMANFSLFDLWKAFRKNSYPSPVS